LTARPRADDNRVVPDDAAAARKVLMEMKATVRVDA